MIGLRPGNVPAAVFALTAAFVFVVAVWAKILDERAHASFADAITNQEAVIESLNGALRDQALEAAEREYEWRSEFDKLVVLAEQTTAHIARHGELIVVLQGELDVAEVARDRYRRELVCNAWPWIDHYRGHISWRRIVFGGDADLDCLTKIAHP